jgi:hypothetical protein
MKKGNNKAEVFSFCYLQKFFFCFFVSSFEVIHPVLQVLQVLLKSPRGITLKNQWDSLEGFEVLIVTLERLNDEWNPAKVNLCSILLKISFRRIYFLDNSCRKKSKDSMKILLLSEMNFWL